MFNFLVTADNGAWDRLGYEYDRSRFLEYTSEDIAVSFREMKSPQIQALTELPCLFAYEGTATMSARYTSNLILIPAFCPFLLTESSRFKLP
jgi:hypothetical protein